MPKCKGCSTDVAADDKSCPHCGIKNPASGRKEIVVGLAAVILGITVLTQCASDSEADKKAAAIEEAKCKQDLQCWGDKSSAAAGAYCRDYIEKLANFTFRWTDKALEPKFSRIRWLNKEGATLTFIGDKIEFQNGFGAYQRHVYECDFDPASKTVLDVSAEPGHL